jgi:hypothetical protein
MRTTDTANFYLVQRLESLNPVDNTRGFDGYFALDYMGSSEFEWGAIPKALKAMREQPAVVEPARVRIGGAQHDVYFVGHQGVSGAVGAMEAWAVGGEYRRPFYGKEWSRFDEVLTGTAHEYVRTDAWWDIESNVAWAVSLTVADRLAKAFNARPRT